MRVQFLLLLLWIATGAMAQPGAPPLSFVLVENERGRPMRGPIAEDGMMVELLSAQGKRPWMVQQLFTVSAEYPYGPEKPGDRVQWTMGATPMQVGGRRYLRFELSDCYCEDQQVVVQRDGQVMRIRVPSDPRERQPLVEAVQRRSGDHASPEVFRFRAGTFTFAELAEEAAFHAFEARLAEGLEHDRAAAYQKQLADQARHDREQRILLPSSVPPQLQTGPTAEELARALAAPPGLEQVSVSRVEGDTVWLRITGRVMLDGGCASNRPLFGIERWADTGWVERVPMQHAQMDCGTPWADWRDHEMMLPPLRWWTGANQPAATRELKPGMYRVVLMGANGERMWTEAFEVR
jgi:hypothetical protein